MCYFATKLQHLQNIRLVKHSDSQKGLLSAFAENVFLFSSSIIKKD